MRRLGVAINCNTIAATVELTKRAEKNGFDSAWTFDTPRRNGYVSLGAMAAVTERIKLAGGVIVAWGRSPTIHATAARDIDEISNGRLILGLGSGTKRQIDYWYSIVVDHPAPQMRELVEMLRMLFASHAGKNIDYEGRFYHMKLERYFREAVREQIPIQIAAVQPRMLQIVGEVGDGLVGHPIFTVPYIKEVVAPAVQRGLDKSGRKREDFELNSYVICSINDDRKKAYVECARTIANYCATRSYAIMFDHHGWQDAKQPLYDAFHAHDVDGMVRALPEEMVRSMAIFGTADDVQEHIARYDGVLDVPILYSPGFAGEPGRSQENIESMIEVFAQK